jgi:hypothetical protein
VRRHVQVTLWLVMGAAKSCETSEEEAIDTLLRFPRSPKTNLERSSPPPVRLTSVQAHSSMRKWSIGTRQLPLWNRLPSNGANVARSKMPQIILKNRRP